MEEYDGLAKTVAAEVAKQGFHLLTGGGAGLMKIVGEEFLKKTPRTGKLISILRAEGREHLTSTWNKKGELRNPTKERAAGEKRSWEAHADNGKAEILIRTHLPYSGDLGVHDLSRNHINVLTSDLVIILPGESGTFAELRLAWEYGRPTMVFLGADGKVDGKSAKDICAKFKGVASAVKPKKLMKWLSKRAPASTGINVGDATTTPVRARRRAARHVRSKDK
jgi:predicted Rossmann-fold nucleotide-binding protein